MDMLPKISLARGNAYLRCGASVLGISAAMSVMSVSAFAQPGGSQPGSRDATAVAPGVADEIVVTARKREESSLEAPIAVQGFTGEQLRTRGITRMEEFARTIPSLILAESSGSTQGGALALRGISAGDGNPFGDQAVAFNIDGVQIARSSVRRMSEMDMAQLEVLKGPQALYFGKNSPGGIVVIRTADPGDVLEVGLQTGYEFNAREIRADAFISTPITDSLGVRVAGRLSSMRGWLENIAPKTDLYGPAGRYLPHSREYNGRITLKYDAGDAFRARFKYSYGSIRGRGHGATNQRIFCPYGIAHYGTSTVDNVPVPDSFDGTDDCRADNKVVRADIPVAFNTLWPAFGDGIPFNKQSQQVGSLELNYDISDNITIDSITGYYRSIYSYMDSGNSSTTLFPNRIFSSSINQNIREISEEIRVTSNFDGPINFLLGGYYQNSKMMNAQISVFDVTAPAYAFVPNRSDQRGEAWSAFLSLSWNPVEKVELSGGARYSHETKKYRARRLLRPDGSPDVSLVGLPFDPAFEAGTAVPKRSFSDLSPEVTVAWKPSSDLNIYGTYRTGFLSGGFQTGSGNLAQDQSYDAQKVKGFEGGVKARSFGGTLRTNLALYRYKISDQQVTTTLGNVQSTTNAASSRVQGIELDFDWRTPVYGLSVRGGGAYNRARYLSYTNAPCYGGQTIAIGCIVDSDGPHQNLSGRRIVRSPDWGGFLGLTFEREISDGLTWGLSADVNYTSGIYGDAANTPQSWQKGYELLDASTFIRQGDWELSLIGRNLTNTYYFQRSTSATLTSRHLADRTAGVLGDTVASVSRGREVWLRISYRFSR